MKTRDSGMPDEELWASFFQPEIVLDKLGLRTTSDDVVEFGCGYGTFTLPAAHRTSGVVYAIDIEPGMATTTSRKAKAAGLANVHPVVRDFVAAGTGLETESMGYAMLFNILHAEEPSLLLSEAKRVLRAGGLLGIMHWNYDATTPRGPAMDIRPRPQQCRDWAQDAGFELVPPGIMDLPPYHYGMVLKKSSLV